MYTRYPRSDLVHRCLRSKRAALLKEPELPMKGVRMADSPSTRKCKWRKNIPVCHRYLYFFLAKSLRYVTYAHEMQEAIQYKKRNNWITFG